MCHADLPPESRQPGLFVFQLQLLKYFSIPRGTLIIMSTRDASLKESNYDDAEKFNPDRWLRSDNTDYHAFASIPFGFGARKCLGQNMSEVMMSVLTMKVINK